MILCSTIPASKDHGLRKSLHGALWRSIQPISLNIISLPAMAYIIRQLGPAGYGTWTTATSLVAATSVLTSLGLRGTFIRGVAQDPDSAPAAFADQLGTRICLTLLAMAVAILSSIFIGYNSLIVQCTAIAALGMLFSAIWTTASDLLESQQHLPATAAAAMIAGLLLTGVSVIVIWLGAGPVALSLAYLIGPLASLWIFFSVLRREHFPITAHFKLRRSLGLLWQSRHFTAQMLLSTLNGSLAMLMLPKLVGLASFGLYSAGVLLISRVAVFPDAIGTAFYPLIAKSNRVDRKLAQHHALVGISVALFTCLCVAVPTALLAGFVARILFPKQPAGCEHVIAITIWALPLVGIETMLGYSLNAAGKEAVQARRSFWSSIVGLAIGAVLVGGWKLEGACWFMLIRSAVQIAFVLPVFVVAFATPKAGHRAVPAVALESVS